MAYGIFAGIFWALETVSVVSEFNLSNSFSMLLHSCVIIIFFPVCSSY